MCDVRPPLYLLRRDPHVCCDVCYGLKLRAEHIVDRVPLCDPALNCLDEKLVEYTVPVVKSRDVHDIEDTCLLEELVERVDLFLMVEFICVL